MKSILANGQEDYADSEILYCNHCGAIVPSNRSDSFCCSGCSAVYHILRGVSVSSTRDSVSKLAANPFGATFAFLDDVAFRNELNVDPTRPQMSFYLENVQCVSCLQRVEMLPDLLPGDVTRSRLNLQTAVLEVTLKPEGSFASVAEYLAKMGYPPHPIGSRVQGVDFAKRESKLLLLRMALAGALSGNIMIFSISIYAGASGFIKEHFDWTILLLSLPVFSFCAWPLYLNAWRSIKNHRWSVDIPIVVALLTGFSVSVSSVFMGGTKNYLDSLSGLVFLLLASRYFLLRLQKNAFDGMRFSDSFYPTKILRNNGEYVWVRELELGDLVEIPAGLRIPIDGTVSKGRGFVNESIITGESAPRRIQEHELVFAGSLNLDSKLWVKVNAVGDDTRMGKIAREIQRISNPSTQDSSISKAVAQYFTVSVMSWAGFVFFYFYAFAHLPFEGVERLMSILIVSCPCAFAIANPLALIRGYQVLLNRGLYLKDPKALEDVSEIKTVVFDKTGTLTDGVLEVSRVDWLTSVSDENQAVFLNIVRELETESTHPVARALLRYANSRLNDAPVFEIEAIHDLPGKGRAGSWNNRAVEIRNGDGIAQNHRCTLWIDGKEIALFSIREHLRTNTESVIHELKKRGLDVWMLSGDHSNSVQEIAEELNISSDHVIRGATPEEKASWFENATRAMYVGDGANDGLALQRAYFGVAAHGALDLSLKASRAYLTRNTLDCIVDIFTVADEVKRMMRRHLIFTICYNGFAITLATCGLLSPLVAAILMPLSSVTILISTQVGTQKLRALR